MRRDSFCLARTLEHEELGENSNRLQPDRERPKDLRDPEFVVEDEREDDAGTEEVFDAEGIDRGVVRWPVGVPDSQKLVICREERDSERR
jgi:hypothetical protein